MTRRQRRLARGAITGFLYAALGLGVAMTATGVGSYYSGKKAERVRSDQKLAQKQAEHDGQMARLRAEAAAKYEQLRAEKIAVERAWLAVKEKADAELDRALAHVRRLEGDVARVAADAVRVRDELSAAVARQCRGTQDPAAPEGGGPAAIGELLGEALQTSRACALDAERLGAGVRALQGAWPVTTSLNPAP
jgi:hypothetical protein